MFVRFAKSWLPLRANTALNAEQQGPRRILLFMRGSLRRAPDYIQRN